MFAFRRRIVPFASALAMPLAAAACGDDPAEPHDDPAENVTAVRLTIGAQTVTVRTSGVTGGPVVLSVGSNLVSAVFLDRDGDVVGGLQDEFELHIESPVSSITFTRSSAFAGSLNATQAGAATTLTVELFHIEEGHGDFEVQLPVTVQ